MQWSRAITLWLWLGVARIFVTIVTHVVRPENGRSKSDERIAILSQVRVTGLSA